MGLQVWLPLNGNLNNQGLSNAAATNNGATVDNNGKIGKCYSFDGTDDFLSLTNINCNAWAQCTVSFWCYPTANFNYMFLIRGSGAHRFRISGDGLVFRDTNHSSQTSVSFNATIATNTWSHITCIYNRGEVFMYVNGILTNHSTTYYNSTSVLLSDLSEYRIARQQSSSGNNYYAGKINDFRIYNHALSAQEVKLLSQGLILHYPLDRNGWGQNNLLPGTDFNGSSKKFTLTSGSEGGFTYTPTETITPSTVYIISCYMRGNANMNLYKICTGGNEAVSWVNRDEFSTEEYRKFTITFSSPGSSKTLNQIYICTRYGSSNSQVGDWFEIKPYSLKMELGNTATTWNPAVSDTFAGTIGFNSDVEYDISGYQNNGIRKNTFTYTTNSSKYKLATIFNGSNNSIVAGQGAKVKDAITISCWGYMNSWSSYNGRLLSCTEGGGWNFEPSSGKMNFAMGTGTSGNTYKSVTSTTTLAQLGSGWHMFTGTYDGFNTKIYIDGVLENTNAAYTTKTPIYYLAANGIFVGAEAAGSATDPTGSYFNGYLSDVRIYSTALSANDILELYNNKVI